MRKIRRRLQSREYIVATGKFVSDDLANSDFADLVKEKMYHMEVAENLHNRDKHQSPFPGALELVETLPDMADTDAKEKLADELHFKHATKYPIEGLGEPGIY